MNTIDTHTWNRTELFNHFRDFKDPRFSMTVPFDVTDCYRSSKQNGKGFFISYLFACMKAINETPNFNLRIEDEKVTCYDEVHASPTILRDDKTFGFTFVKYDPDFEVFNTNFQNEKTRVLNSSSLFPPEYSINCIHCSANHFMVYTAHVEPVAKEDNGVPQLSFSKTYNENDRMLMNVGINVHHGLIDGYHVGQFVESFQKYLNNSVK